MARGRGRLSRTRRCISGGPKHSPSCKNSGSDQAEEPHRASNDGGSPTRSPTPPLPCVPEGSGVLATQAPGDQSGLARAAMASSRSATGSRANSGAASATRVYRRSHAHPSSGCGRLQLRRPAGRQMLGHPHENRSTRCLDSISRRSRRRASGCSDRERERASPFRFSSRSKSGSRSADCVRPRDCTCHDHTETRRRGARTEGCGAARCAAGIEARLVITSV